VFSENLLNLFFKGNNASLAQAVATGSILIPLFAISYACAELLVRMRKMRYVLSLEGIAAITHGILMIVLLQSMGDSLFGILIAQIVPLAVFTVLSFILVLRGIQYRIDYMRRLAFPAAAAGLVCLAFNKLLSSFAGSTVSMIICIPVGIVIYIILLLILKAISEDEIQKLPLAGMILFIGKLTRLL
jgi:O-antigen/teichoic acid export membrane protein